LRAVLKRKRRVALALIVLLAGLTAAKAWHDTMADTLGRTRQGAFTAEHRAALARAAGSAGSCASLLE
jgi:hypothetical protein